MEKNGDSESMYYVPKATELINEAFRSLRAHFITIFINYNTSYNYNQLFSDSVLGQWTYSILEDVRVPTWKSTVIYASSVS